MLKVTDNFVTDFVRLLRKHDVTISAEHIDKWQWEHPVLSVEIKSCHYDESNKLPIYIDQIEDFVEMINLKMEAP